MEKDEIEIDLKEVFMYVMGHLAIIILSGLIGAMGMYYFSATFMDKKFQSSTKIYVLNQQDDKNSVTYSDLQMGSQLTKDYAELIVSRTVTTRTIAELALQERYSDMKNITPDGLKDMITVTTQTDNRVITITVTDTSPTRAQDIANEVRIAASEHIAEVMDIQAVNVVDYANLPDSQVSPNLMKSAVIGGLVGVFLSIVIIVIVFLTDDTIKTPDDVERYLGLSVLASIPYDDAIDTALEAKKKRKAKGSKKPAPSQSRAAAVRSRSDEELDELLNDINE